MAHTKQGGPGFPGRLLRGRARSSVAAAGFQRQLAVAAGSGGGLSFVAQERWVAVAYMAAEQGAGSQGAQRTRLFRWGGAERLVGRWLPPWAAGGLIAPALSSAARSKQLSSVGGEEEGAMRLRQFSAGQHDVKQVDTAAAEVAEEGAKVAQERRRARRKRRGWLRVQRRQG